MERLNITFLLAFTIIVIIGCLGNTGSEPTEVTDPSATTHLHIVNQSDLDLNATYKATDAYAGLDSTVAIPAGSTTLIFDPGGFSSFPAPSEALVNLNFYKTSDGTTSPILTVEPIIDEDWN